MATRSFKVKNGLIIGGGIEITSILDEDNMASVSATALATQQSIKAYVDAQIATEDTLAELNDTNITSAADGSLLLYDTDTSTWRDAAMSGDATISDTGVITLGANSVDSAEITTGAIDLTHMSANSVDSDQYVDGSIDAIHLSANSVDSDAYVDGSIDAIHLSANSVDSDAYVDDSIDLAHMSSESVDEDNLHISNAGSNGQFLSKQSGNSGGLTWAAAGDMSDLTDDTSPQLGGDLDVNGQDIVSTSNADIDIIPNGTGDVNLGADTVQVGDNNADATITTQGTGDLILNTNNGTNAGNITLADGANGNITLTANGTGKIQFNDLAYIPQQAITSSSNAVAWDVQAKPNAYHLTTENTTFSAPTNAVEGAFICLEINFDGSHTIGWNTIFEFAASTEPEETATNGKTDLHVFRYNGAIWQEVGRTLNLSEN